MNNNITVILKKRKATGVIRYLLGISLGDSVWEAHLERHGGVAHEGGAPGHVVRDERVRVGALEHLFPSLADKPRDGSRVYGWRGGGDGMRDVNACTRNRTIKYIVPLGKLRFASNFALNLVAS
jgi:hypothetical protein